MLRWSLAHYRKTAAMLREEDGNYMWPQAAVALLGWLFEMKPNKTFGDFMHKKMFFSAGYKKLAAWYAAVNEERMSSSSFWS